jgi:hypothetical protein
VKAPRQARVAHQQDAAGGAGGGVVISRLVSAWRRLWSVIVQDCPTYLRECEDCREPFCNVSDYLKCERRLSGRG